MSGNLFKKAYTQALNVAKSKNKYKYKNKKNLDTQKSSKFDLIGVLLFLIPFMLGSISLWSNFFIALICILGIIMKVMKNKKLILPKGKNIILLCLYILSFLFVEIYAIDKGMNLLGLFKNIVILLFAILYLQYQYEETEKKKLFELVPISGIISLIISICMLDVTGIVNDDRFQGIFLYANSYALFLLIGVVILLMKEEIKIKDSVIVLLLLVGIIFTNSRAMILISFIVMIAILILNSKNRKKVAGSLICFIIVFTCVYTFLNLENRVNSEMFQSSEFVTRLMYYKDAIDMVKSNPFGYGYMGYYYKQVEVQTGIYDTQYAHNSILQVALDVGIIPMAVLCILIIKTFFNKKQSILNRLILIVIIGHSMIDIDMEYMYFIYLITMMINFKTFEIKANKLFFISSGLVGCLYSTLFLGTFIFNFGCYEAAYSILPFYTDALQEELYMTTSIEKQLEIANKILPLNKNVSGVYEALSNEAQKNKNYEKALEYEKKRLSLNKYSMKNYMYYLEFLSEAWQYYLSMGNEIEANKYADEILNIENIINKVVEETNPLNEKTKHKLELKMPEDMKRYIEQVREVNP